MTVRLKEQSDRLAAEKQLLSDAIADLFHQMRTPLTAMNLLVSMLAEEDLPDEKRLRYLRELKTQMERIRWIAETLLKCSKLDANSVRFAPETLTAAELIDAAVEPLRVPMELKGIAFSAADNGTALHVDRAWTVEALANILKNATEHTPAGGAVRVEAEETALYTRITVRDTGAGFAPDELGHVFERFWRGRQASNDSIGIGLALSRQIIAEQGGTVTAKNADGGGAQFVITFYKTVL